jgi:multisubunit Na+/H+ antiporter MnhB subunit
MELARWLRNQWDRVGAWAAVAIGALMLVVGWFRVSESAFPAQQIPYLLSAGVGGLFLLGLGVALWLSADLRDEWRKLDDIQAEIHALEETLRASGRS